MYRIPKRRATGGDASAAKKTRNETPNSSETPDSFTEYDTKLVQFNSWEIDISRMDEIIEKVLFKVTLVMPDGKSFELSKGVSSVSGDVNRQIRRQAQCLLFDKWFEKNPQLFKGQTNSKICAYDAAETIYVGKSNFSGEFDEHSCELTEEDFSSESWETISMISRKAGAKFKILIRHAGHLFTRGPEALSEKNRPELTRCVETVTNQILQTTDFLLYSSGTYPVHGLVLSIPDDVTEIKSGFSKVSRIVEGPGGVPKAILTIDITRSAFYKPMPLLKFFQSKFNSIMNVERGLDGFNDRGGYGGNNRYNDARRDSRGGRGGRDDEVDSDALRKLQRKFEEDCVTTQIIEKLKKALKGLICQPILMKDTKANRCIIIDGIDQSSADKMTLDYTNENGTTQNINITEYYREKHSLQLKFPHLPLITSKRRGQLFPIEMLEIIPGQRVKMNQMTADIQSDMTGRNAALPLQHIAQSRNIMKNYLNLSKGVHNPHLEGFNIRFTISEPITAKAKILAPPCIKFREQTSGVDLSGGVRFQTCGKFVRPATVQDVVIINYDVNYAETDVREFCDAVATKSSKHNVKFMTEASDWKIVITHPDDIFKTRKTMEQAVKDGVTIVIGIVYEKKPDIHDVMKYYEEKFGQQTLQITVDTAKRIANSDNERQIMDSVLRKFNLKCGGTNFFVELQTIFNRKLVCRDKDRMYRKLYQKTQFIGFGISHAGARTQYEKQEKLFRGEPTYIGVAYSLNHSTELGGFFYDQESRLHKISRINEKFVMCFEAYEKSAKFFPQTIAIYRFGSGEGDYAQVALEVNEMREVAKAKGCNPKFVVILAQRHSHVRIFPENVDGRTAYQQNVRSGTCVDSIGSAHGLDEFILCCQTPIIGTVRPTRYTVIVNDAEWTKNEIMNVTYHLAFGHQVSYGPPAVPNVLYAAANLAKRGHNNYLMHTKLVDMGDYAPKLQRQYEVSEEQVRDAVINNCIVTVSDEINNLRISGHNFWA